MMYKPREYWESRGRTYLQENLPGEAERRYWIKRMVKILTPFSVLETGCGPGKNFPAFKDIPLPYATDFSQSALNSIPDRMGVNVHWADTRDLPFVDKNFDLVISCTHLVHIPYGEDQIKKAVTELCRVSREYLLLMEFWDPEVSVPELASWCFRHDYPTLVAKHGFTEVERRTLSAKIGLFLFRRRIP